MSLNVIAPYSTGNALVKMEKLEEAVVVYESSLMEHRNADTLDRKNKTQKLIKDRIKAGAYTRPLVGLTKAFFAGNFG